jgi:hypothetical protein
VPYLPISAGATATTIFCFAPYKHNGIDTLQTFLYSVVWQTDDEVLGGVIVLDSIPNMTLPNVFKRIL